VRMKARGGAPEPKGMASPTKQNEGTLFAGDERGFVSGEMPNLS